MNKKRTAITPTREENYPEWYLSVLKAADLAEHSDVRGCMVIKPWGFAIWENIQKDLDVRFKATGHENAYFPLFIPLSYFQKEAEHVEGFAKECAVVTHHKLEQKEGKLVPSGKLEEPLIVRPTSEMIIGHTFSKWIESYRDLPLKINQWCNIVRWEMRCRIFLRTAEILWQEGHTVHATEKEAREEAMQMIEVYRDFCKEVLAMPVIAGEKIASERFPGAEDTYTIEAMMQDGKAIQAGTSHFLGQTFSKACDIVFQNAAEEREHGWMTSWGVTTRLVGGVIMTHGDDDGLILPPKLASAQIVILPIIHQGADREAIESYVGKLKEELSAKKAFDEPLRVRIDLRDLRGGEKKWSWVKKGVPILIEVGPKEMESGRFMLFSRDTSERQEISKEALLETISAQLTTIQSRLYEKALSFQQERTKEVLNKEALYAFFEGSQTAGFAVGFFHEDLEAEKALKEDLNVTVRCIPFETIEERGPCLFSGKEGAKKAIFARAY